MSESFGWVSVLDDGNFEVSLRHLTLEGVLESLNSGVDSITDVHVVCVSFLEEGTSLTGASAQSSRLPAVKSA